MTLISPDNLLNLGERSGRGIMMVFRVAVVLLTTTGGKMCETVCGTIFSLHFSSKLGLTLMEGSFKFNFLLKTFYFFTKVNK